MCPTGRDPLAVNTSPKEITWTITSTHSNGFVGFVGLEYLGSRQFLSLAANDPITCGIVFQTASNLNGVSCSYTTYTSNLIQIIITFSSGEPTASDFYCDVTTANAGVQCVFADVVSAVTEGL